MLVKGWNMMDEKYIRKYNYSKEYEPDIVIKYKGNLRIPSKRNAGKAMFAPWLLAGKIF